MNPGPLQWERGILAARPPGHLPIPLLCSSQQDLSICTCDPFQTSHGPHRARGTTPRPPCSGPGLQLQPTCHYSSPTTKFHSTDPLSAPQVELTTPSPPRLAFLQPVPFPSLTHTHTHTHTDSSITNIAEQSRMLLTEEPMLTHYYYPTCIVTLGFILGVGDSVCVCVC